ncbi:MAG: tail fiber protein [Alphaproteobacteria bacterium]|nr:tail fiber protein [Alphaproteobacteria bacterium]
MSRLSWSYLFLSSAAVLLVTAAEASAQTCTEAPGCAELGYTQTASECSGKAMVKCPFDSAKVFCGVSKSCAQLGYTMTTAQCSGRKYVTCPYDTSKVVCDTGAIIGEIRLWAGSSAPKGWKICDGSSLSTTTYSALYAVIGTTYGGSGSYFYLPNFKGRVPVGVGYATSSVYTYSRGSKGGEEKHTLTISEMPSHNHALKFVSNKWGDNANNRPFPSTSGTDSYSASTAYAGGSVAHENRMPYLGIYYIIYTGVY